jgi:hypothetical protein
MAKSAKRRSVKKATIKVEGRPITAAEIVVEIVSKMDRVLAFRGKKFSPTALSEWRPKLLDAVDDRLRKGGDWKADRSAVLAVAGDMARIAAIISGPLPTVAKARVHAAFRAVKDHEMCPNDAGSGKWCRFDV